MEANTEEPIGVATAVPKVPRAVVTLDGTNVGEAPKVATSFDAMGSLDCADVAEMSNGAIATVVVKTSGVVVGCGAISGSVEVGNCSSLKPVPRVKSLENDAGDAMDTGEVEEAKDCTGVGEFGVG